MKDDKTIIKTIIEFIGFIEDDCISCNDVEDFLENETVQRACSLSLIQIGELVKRLSPGFTKAHDEIEWSEIAKLRDYLAHRYSNVNPYKIWCDITEDIPKLKDYLMTIMKE